MLNQKGELLRDETARELARLKGETSGPILRVVELLHERLALIERRLEDDDRRALEGTLG